MGLLTGMFTMPVRGLLRVFEEVAQRADAELYDEDAVKAELVETYRALEAGMLGEEEFAARELELVQRLEVIAEHKQARAGRAHA